MTPQSDLADLLASLPAPAELSVQDRAGRTPLPQGTALAGGDYILAEEIGCGSFGLIYAARDVRMGQELAIKEFFPRGALRSEQQWAIVAPEEMELPSLRSQFEEEFRVLERFERPGIVKVYDLFSEKGGLFLVMERLIGATFEEILRAHGKLEEALALWLIRRLVSTLETIHLSGLVHGDIKPENLYLTHEGGVILLDFGAVNHYLSRHNKAPRFLTPGYAPPEQYQPKSTPDPASDLYAVGATLYQLLTGSPPPESMERTRGARLPSPTQKGADVSPATVAALARTLALSREKRPASAHELLGLLPDLEVRTPAEIAPWEVLTPWLGHKGAIARILLTSDGQFLASSDKAGQIRLWSTEQQKCLGVMDWEREIIDIAIHPEDRWIAVAFAGGQVELIDFSSGKPEATVREGTPPVSSLAFSPDGTLLICGLFDGRVELRSLAVKGKKKILRAHDSPVNRLCFSPSGRLLAMASNDRSASIWDMKSGRRLRSFEDHHRPVQVVQFSPSGRFLVTGGSDMSIRVFDVKRGDEFRRLKGHEAMVWDAMFLEEDDRLITCSADRTVRMWDMHNFRECSAINLSDGWLCSMRYCGATSTLFVGGVDKAIHRLKVTQGALARQV